MTGHYEIPAIYIRYDLSPITVQFTEVRKSFGHFLVQVSAIVGGTYTVLGLVGQLAHKSVERAWEKAQLGKLG